MQFFKPKRQVHSLWKKSFIERWSNGILKTDRDTMMIVFFLSEEDVDKDACLINGRLFYELSCNQALKGLD